MDELQREEITSFEKARLIEDNAIDVEAVITVFRSAVAAGMDWNDLGRMLAEEKENGNPLLEIVHSLHLERNEVTVMLTPMNYEGEENDEMNNHNQTEKAKLVDVELSLSARQNADKYYKKKKLSSMKKVRQLSVTQSCFQRNEKKRANFSPAVFLRTVSHHNIFHTCRSRLSTPDRRP